MRVALFFIVLLTSCGINAQVYSDYIGAGHADGITVFTSSDESFATGINTLNGSGMDARKFEASRFLAQGAFGASLAEIDDLATTLDFEGWIDNQLALPGTAFTDSFWDLWFEVLDHYEDNGFNTENSSPTMAEFNYTWWQNVMDGDDQLRQRMAYALSQILVISTNAAGIQDWPHGVTDYYDIFMNNAFGNYKDILTEVALHPMMGVYLSHLNNPKSIPELNIHPDENFAREIMQLFSIGLYELNPDGTEVLDIDGNPVASYDQEDIKNLAKVFTGLGPSELEPWIEYYDEPFFGMSLYEGIKTGQMMMYEDWHETGEKVIVGGNIIPDGQTGMEDINQAIDILFNHPNVGPFLAYRLIQRFVVSNPSPAYIERVSNVFADNGSGIRGDMGAVIKAVLLDEEARSCEVLTSSTAGRIREPILRYTQIAKGIDLNSELGRYWNVGYPYHVATNQLPMYAPSVFNFYLPDHTPAGEMTENNLVSPEMQLIDTRTATTYINTLHVWTSWGNFMGSWVVSDPPITINSEYYEPLADDLETLIHAYDLLFTHGQLSDQTRTNMRESLEVFQTSDNYAIARSALLMILFSPDYMVPR